MVFKKIISMILCISALLSLLACDKNVFAQNDGFTTVLGVETPKTNYTPLETVEAALRYLKEADTNSFNQYIYYPIDTDRTVVYAYNIMFGNNLDGESKEYIESIVDELTYEIGNIQEGEDNAVVSVNVTNRDLSDINMFAYVDEDNPLIAAIKNADNGYVTSNIEINLSNKDGIWKLLVDSEFQKAISGNYWM
jgi:hypothetical protein